ncbi:MAG: LPS assembly lipoprotein LptE [Phycisphaerae bacterium]
MNTRYPLPRRGAAAPAVAKTGTPTRRARRAAAALLAGVLVAPLVGCGYTAGGPYRRDVRTVYVDMFESKEFRRDIEFHLTEAVKKRIATDTPYRLAPREKADTILRGEVLEERVAAFAPDFRSRLARDKQVTLAVRIEWKDVRTGQLIDRPALLQSVDYLTPTGETEKLAQERAIDRLAGRIVAQMYDENW